MIKRATLCGLAAAIALPATIQAQRPPQKPAGSAELLDLGDPLGAGEIGGSLPTRPALPGSVSAEEKRAAEERRGMDEKAEKKGKGPTEITAPQATFDQKANQAVFTGSAAERVVVKDPEFNVVCDKLTAFLKSPEKNGASKENEATSGAAAAPKSATPRPGTVPKSGDPTLKKAGGGGLQKAVAEAAGANRVLISQDKADADGSVSHSTGSGRRATYDAVTGDIVLTGRPEIQQGINRVVATAEGTVMTLNRDGHMRADGPTRTSIEDKGDADSKRK